MNETAESRAALEAWNRQRDWMLDAGWTPPAENADPSLVIEES